MYWYKYYYINKGLSSLVKTKRSRWRLGGYMSHYIYRDRFRAGLNL